jgi:hypothetical protein
MTKIIVWLIVILLIIFGAVSLLGRSVGDSDLEVLDDTEMTAEDEAMTKVEHPLKSIPGVKTASLVAVDGSSSSGSAYIVRVDGKLIHLVEANMPNPASGNSYEGWLVDASASPLKFFSTGVMKKNETGVWVLEYVGDKEYLGYNRVVITEETVVDAKPEKHIIEGDF